MKGLRCRSRACSLSPFWHSRSLPPLLTAPVGPADASSTIVKACVKKGSGQMRILSGAKARKKCKKGWKKISWNVTGARGLPGANGNNGANGGTGPAGPPQYVRDRNGTALGQFLGVFPQEVPVFVVLSADGGIYDYLADGHVFANASPRFTTNTCAGSAYLASSNPVTTSLYTGSAGGQSRIVYRPDSPSFGPISAFKITATTTAVVAAPTWERNDTGTCVALGGAFTGDLIALSPVTAPQDGAGPLTIS
jgi:hypothetical protein